MARRWLAAFLLCAFVPLWGSITRTAPAFRRRTGIAPGEAVRMTAIVAETDATHSCAASLAATVPDPADVPELCRHAPDGVTDQVCAQNLARRRMEASTTEHCRSLGADVCRQLRDLTAANQSALQMWRWAQQHRLAAPRGPGLRVLRPSDVRRVRWERRSATLGPGVPASLSDPNTCDVRLWLGPCPLRRPTPRLVVVSHGANRSVEWLRELGDVPYLVYSRGRPTNASHHQYIPGSFGNEAAVYIKFILDCWDRLPGHVAFIHDHRESYHNSDMVQILRRLHWERFDYASINLKTTAFSSKATPQYFHSPFLNHTTGYARLQSVWRDYFQLELGPLAPTFPRKFNCAQHVASRQVIQRRSRTFWLRLYAWLMRETMDSYHSGRCLEFTWSLILGGSLEPPLIPMCELLRCD